MIRCRNIQRRCFHFQKKRNYPQHELLMNDVFGKYNNVPLSRRRKGFFNHQHLCLNSSLPVQTLSTAAAAAAIVEEERRETFCVSNFYETEEMRRLMRLRNVGIMAHVDAGKTNVTERFLELAGIVRQAGSVDSGNTVTDYLDAERKRGITIQSAAISFKWGWKCSYHDDIENVDINLVDTPGHVDFSVEVNRSVAVLDGAVLVVDAVAGVQAQTETVWRTMTARQANVKQVSGNAQRRKQEPLACLAFVNKMDKDGSNLEACIDSIRRKLPGSNPVAVQLPVFVDEYANLCTSDQRGASGFVGVIDLVNMRQIIYGQQGEPPSVKKITTDDISQPSSFYDRIYEARASLVAVLADVDEEMEEFFLLEIDPTNAQLRDSLRRATISRDILPVMVGSALKGKGIEPLLDNIAELLPSPLERNPPKITEERLRGRARKSKKSNESLDSQKETWSLSQHGFLSSPPLGYPLNNTLVAFAFKVLHMKGLGSGDGRVVFARVYSGVLKSKSVVKVFSPSSSGSPTNGRSERISSLLEIAGGRFTNLEDGIAEAGEVCALIGLKGVVTGDTIVQGNDKNNSKKKMKGNGVGDICLAGVESPKPVLTVRLEAATSADEKKMSDALSLLAIEDPSIEVKESDSTSTLLSGLGELHIEVIVDRLRSEFGVDVYVGEPSVSYKETVTSKLESEDGLINYDREIGGVRIQAAISLVLEPINQKVDETSEVLKLVENEVIFHQRAREFLELDEDEDEKEFLDSNTVVNSLVNGIKGSLRRGVIGPYPMTNIRCHVIDIDCDRGLGGLRDNPGAIRASAANAINVLLSSGDKTNCTVLEPRMHIEVNAPEGLVGSILSDFNNRRGTVGDVLVGDGDHDSNATPEQVKAFISGTVPLAEILGYASTLRSITGGEGTFSAEYKGHASCDLSNR